MKGCKKSLVNIKDQRKRDEEGRLRDKGWRRSFDASESALISALGVLDRPFVQGVIVELGNGTGRRRTATGRSG